MNKSDKVQMIEEFEEVYFRGNDKEFLEYEGDNRILKMVKDMLYSTKEEAREKLFYLSNLKIQYLPDSQTLQLLKTNQLLNATYFAGKKLEFSKLDTFDTAQNLSTICEPLCTLQIKEALKMPLCNENSKDNNNNNKNKESVLKTKKEIKKMKLAVLIEFELLQKANTYQKFIEYKGTNPLIQCLQRALRESKSRKDCLAVKHTVYGFYNRKKQSLYILEEVITQTETKILGCKIGSKPTTTISGYKVGVKQLKWCYKDQVMKYHSKTLSTLKAVKIFKTKRHLIIDDEQFLMRSPPNL